MVSRKRPQGLLKSRLKPCPSSEVFQPPVKNIVRYLDQGFSFAFSTRRFAAAISCW
jgi:hypothetical protein